MDTLEQPKVTFKRVFKFRYKDFALLFGMTQAAVRKAAQRGLFDPSDLNSIVKLYNKKQETSDSKVKESLSLAVDGMKRAAADLQKLSEEIAEKNRTVRIES